MSFNKWLSAQKISIVDMMKYCNADNWNDVNSVVTSNNWNYYSSTAGDSKYLSKITWSYNLGYDYEKAQAWLYLYTYNSTPEKVAYSVFNKEAYNYVINGLASNGFKTIKSEILDDILYVKYESENFYLEVETIKRKKESNKYYQTEEFHISYLFILVRKYSSMDTKNGFKQFYFEGTENKIQYEYTLKNNEFDGVYKEYFFNGNLKFDFFYKLGKKHGIQREYNYDGELLIETNYINNLKNGIENEYENGKIILKRNYVNDELNGEVIKYEYLDENLFFKSIFEYKNDKLNGKTIVYKVIDGVEKPYLYGNFKDDIRHGKFKMKYGVDTFVECTYIDGNIEGVCTTSVLREMINKNTGEEYYTEDIYEISNFVNGVKNGSSNFYYFGNIIKKGEYFNGEKNGPWIEYVWIGRNLGKILSIKNYINGEINGKVEEFFDLEYIDSIRIFEFHEIYNKYYYSEGLMSGEYYSKDSLNGYEIFGQYLKGEKDGFWSERFKNGDSFYIFKGNYSKNEKNNEWRMYSQSQRILFTQNYKDGKLNGGTKYFRENGSLFETIEYDKGVVKSYVYFEELNNNYDKYILISPFRFKFELRSGEIKEEIYYNTNFILTDSVFLDLRSYYFNEETYQLESSSIIKDGLYQYFINDTLLIKGNYHNGKMDNDWVFFDYKQKAYTINIYSDNVVISEVFYNLDNTKYEGKFKIVNEEKGTYEILKIENGLRNGKAKLYDLKTNKLIEKIRYIDGLRK